MKSELTPQRLDENGNVRQEFYEFAIECCKNGIEIYVDINGYENLYQKGKFGKDSKKSKAISQFTKEGVYVRDFAGQTEAHRITKVSQGAIGNVCRGEQKSAGGFIWKFKELQYETN